MEKKFYLWLYVLAGVSLGVFLTSRIFPWNPGEIKTMIQASRLMEEAINQISSCREQKGLTFDLKADPNQTGLIGLGRSILTTSLGQLEAKRTTTNPNFAGLIAYLLLEAGVRPGEAVAIGASSSFPALILASLAAVRSLEAVPVYIVSLGASQWGANDPQFTWLDIEDCLRQSGWLSRNPVTVSLGGGRDVGQGMALEGRFFLQEAARERGLHLLEEPDLEKNVSLRLRLYEEGAGKRRLAAFINIGGGWANMGEEEEILHVQPGLNLLQPPPGAQGVVWEMARNRVPVIHLLFIKGLTERYGLPWDPRPLPSAGEGGFYQLARRRATGYKALAAAYLLFVLISLSLYRLFSPFTRSR